LHSISESLISKGLNEKIVFQQPARGVNKNNARLSAYRDFLHSLSSRKDELFEDERNLKLWREVHELTWVLTVFKDNNLDPPTELLKRSLDGKPLEEYENESGRNLFLELRAAIYFLRVGYQVTLNEQCDVIAIRKRNRIFIECKRVYSEKKARERIRQCYGQLESRLMNADKRFKNLGLAWIDPSPAMQKHYFVYTAYSEAGARNAARMDLIYFWKEWISKVYGGNEKRIFALILQMVWPSWIAGTKGVRTGFTSYVIPGHAKTGFFGMIKARRLLDEIMSIEEA